MQNQRRPGARPARLAGLTPAASRAAAPRVQGPSLAQSEVTADTGNGEPASCLHPTGVPFHWSPPNVTPRWSPYIQPSGSPHIQPITNHSTWGFPLDIPHASPITSKRTSLVSPHMDSLICPFDASFPLCWPHGSLLPPTHNLRLSLPRSQPLSPAPQAHTPEPWPTLPPLGQRSDPRARGPQAPRHLQARTADGVAQRGTAHRAAPAPIRGPGAPAARRPNPAHAPQTKGPAAPASPRRPRNLLAGKCP